MNSITGHPKSREKNSRPSNTHWASELRKSHERTREVPPIRTNVVKPCKDCKHYEGKVVFGRGQDKNDKEEENVETVTRETRQDRERRLEQGLAFYSNWVDDLEEKSVPILLHSYESARHFSDLRNTDTANSSGFKRNDNTDYKNKGFTKNDNSNYPSGKYYPSDSGTNSKQNAQLSPNKFPNSMVNLTKNTDGKLNNDINKHMTQQGQQPWLVTVPGNANIQGELRKVSQGILNRNNWSQKSLTNYQQQSGQRLPEPQYNVQHKEKIFQTVNNFSPKNQYNPHIYDKSRIQHNPSTRELQYINNYSSIPRTNPQKDPYIHRRGIEIDDEEKETIISPYRPNSLAQFYNPFLNAQRERKMQFNVPRLDYDDDDDDMPRRRDTFEEYLGSRAPQPRTPFVAGPSPRRQTGYWNSPPNVQSTTRYDPPNSIRHGTLLKEIQCAKKHAETNKANNKRQFDL